MKTLIVHNVSSGYGSDAIFEFERMLLGQGDRCEIRTLGGGQEAPDVIADAEDFDLVVLSGGDGTVSRLLYHLRYREVPTCVFPSGTSNLFFYNLGNTHEPTGLAKACKELRCTHTDLGQMAWTDTEGTRRVTGFCIMAGFGFDAQIMRDAVPNKPAMGEVAYFFAALANPTPDVVSFTIELDGKVIEREGISCIIANNAMIQSEIEVVPDCTMADGLLDVIVLETSDAVQLLSPLFAGILDKTGKSVGRPMIENFKARHVRVTPSKPLPLQVDGDAMVGLSSFYEAQSLAGANRLIVDKTSRYPAD